MRRQLAPLLVTVVVGLSGCSETDPAQAAIPMIDAIALGDIELIRIHLAGGAEVNEPDGLGRTLLHHAIYKQDASIVQLILDAGADVNLPDRDGNTPFLLAIASQQEDIITLLLERDDINFEAATNGSSSPLTEAVASRDRAMAQRLLDLGAEINGPGPHGRTVMHMVAFWGDRDMAEWLLREGADPNARCDAGQTPLHFLAQTMIDVEDFGDHPLARGSTLEFFLEHAAELDAQDQFGLTPLHHAATWAHPILTQILLERGADPTLRNINGYTPASFIGSSTGAFRSADENRSLIRIFRDAGFNDDTPIDDHGGTFGDLVGHLEDIGWSTQWRPPSESDDEH